MATPSARVDSPKTVIMMGVNESSMKGYPHASISSKSAFEWTINKIIQSNTSGFKLLFLHVQTPDEDGIIIITLFLTTYFFFIYIFLTDFRAYDIIFQFYCVFCVVRANMIHFW